MTIGALGAPKTDRFDGSRERTLRFLTQFQRFMLMNEDATISRNPIKWCAYFLFPIEGPKVGRAPS